MALVHDADSSRRVEDQAPRDSDGRRGRGRRHSMTGSREDGKGADTGHDGREVTPRCRQGVSHLASDAIRADRPTVPKPPGEGSCQCTSATQAPDGRRPPPQRSNRGCPSPAGGGPKSLGCRRLLARGPTGRGARRGRRDRGVREAGGYRGSGGAYHSPLPWASAPPHLGTGVRPGSYRSATERPRRSPPRDSGLRTHQLTVSPRP